MEDGKPQAVNFFEEHTASVVPPLTLPALPPHVYSNQPAAPPGDSVSVLLLDSLNTPEQDQARVHKQIVDFLLKMDSGARIAIFTLSTRLRLLLGFTADSSLLKAALNGKAAAPGTNPASRTRDDDLRDKEDLSIVGEMANTGGADSGTPLVSLARSQADFANTQGGQRASLTLAALQQLARSLAGIPGRKNLIWFASSFPVSVFPDGSSRQTLSNGHEIVDAVRQTANLLTQARVALYPISAQGILLDRTTNADSGGQPEGDDFEKSPFQQTAANAANSAVMEQLARDTGGKAIYTTNDLGKATERVIQNGANYYTLAYTPTDEKMDGRFRSIEIKLAKSKYELAYRRGYYASDSTAPQPTPASDPLAPLLARGAPSATQLLYQVRTLPVSPQPAHDAVRAGGNPKLAGPFIRYKVDFAITTAGMDLESVPDGTHSGKIEVALIAYGRDGAALNWTGGAMTMNLNAASYAAAQHSGLPARIEIDVPNTAAYLSTGVFDLNSGKAGTLEIPLSVVVDNATTTASTPPKDK